MTASDLVVAIRPVVEALEALGVTFYLTGSVASSAHGIARASLDADIVADLQPAHVQPLIDRLGSAYYIPVDRLRDAVRRRSSCNLIHLETAHAPCRRLRPARLVEVDIEQLVCACSGRRHGVLTSYIHSATLQAWRAGPREAPSSTCAPMNPVAR